MPEFLTINPAAIQMWALFGLIVVALVFYASERISMELTSFGVVCALLLFFHLFPVVDQAGANRLGPVQLLQGFANPALISVLALLVIGQGMVRTGLLEQGARLLLGMAGQHSWIALFLILFVALVISGFLNNIPVVVIFIPIMEVVASRFGMSASKVMIPLSFAAVLGGMTTIIGSSTNLLVNSALLQLGEKTFGFFDFTIPGFALAAVGLVYLLIVAPRLLPDRATYADSFLGSDGKQFIAQITVSENSDRIGQEAPGGHFADVPEDVTVRIVLRGDMTFTPPFLGYTVQSGDVLVVTATRQALMEILTQDPGLLYPELDHYKAPDHLGDESSEERWREGERLLSEVMVAPNSTYIGQTLSQIGFRYFTHCIVLAIERRDHLLRERLTDIPLRAGDVLLVKGQPEDMDALKKHDEIIPLDRSVEELPVVHHAKIVMFIFASVVFLAATGLIPIVAAALGGAVAMVATGVLSVRQATRAIDPLIYASMGTALALGVALKETGGAEFLATAMIGAVRGAGPAVVLSLFFLLVAVLANIVSTKTTAVLFTPIAINIAHQVGAPPEAFVVAVIFAANCSFSSPLGYQTNLVVMGPGHYRFMDFPRVGAPLIVILWLTFTLVAPWYYGL